LRYDVGMVIKGREILRNQKNSIYPKFYILGRDRTGFLTEVLETEEIFDIYNFNNGDLIYEPIEGGLGVFSSLLLVNTDERSYVFEYPNSDIRWGSTIVCFLDDFNYNGEYGV